MVIGWFINTDRSKNHLSVALIRVTEMCITTAAAKILWSNRNETKKRPKIGLIDRTMMMMTIQYPIHWAMSHSLISSSLSLFFSHSTVFHHPKLKDQIPLVGYMIRLQKNGHSGYRMMLFKHYDSNSDSICFILLTLFFFLNPVAAIIW